MTKLLRGWARGTRNAPEPADPPLEEAILAADEFADETVVSDLELQGRGAGVLDRGGAVFLDEGEDPQGAAYPGLAVTPMDRRAEGADLGAGAGRARQQGQGGGRGAIRGMHRAAPRRQAPMFSQELARGGMQDADVPVVPLDGHVLPEPPRGRGVVGRGDFDGAVEMDRARAELVVAKGLDGERQEGRPLFGEHGGDLPPGGAVDARVGPATEKGSAAGRGSLCLRLQRGGGALGWGRDGLGTVAPRRIARMMSARRGPTSEQSNAGRYRIRRFADGKDWRRAAAGALAGLSVACASPPASHETAVGGADSRAAASTVPGPRFDAGGPDAEDYGARDGYPLGDRATFFRIPFLVGSHSHLDQVFEGRLVRPGATASPLRRAAAEPAIRYEHDGQTFSLDDYLGRHPTTGLLIARGDTILVERYQYARNDRHRFTSWSMGKTVTAMLVGIAIADGRIRSLDDRADAYVPELARTEYGRTSLRHLLQMSSGVRFREEYTGDDDVSQLARDTFIQLGPGGVDAVKKFNERVAPSGTRFSYASVETQVLGLVLTRAVGRPVADYLAERIWRPIGAEADATWLIDRSGQEVTFCCVNAVLRDYGRFGLLLAHDGNWRGRQIIPAAWVREATTVRSEDGHLRPMVATPFFGYGYQTWIFPSEQRRFALLGVRGQSIFVDPQSRLVMVHTAVRKLPRDPGGRETTLLWRALVQMVGN